MNLLTGAGVLRKCIEFADGCWGFKEMLFPLPQSSLSPAGWSYRSYRYVSGRVADLVGWDEFAGHDGGAGIDVMSVSFTVPSKS